LPEAKQVNPDSVLEILYEVTKDNQKTVVTGEHELNVGAKRCGQMSLIA
jgi:ABC-type cobalamin/Fe3+-siderophores transport system ATPase subunit